MDRYMGIFATSGAVQEAVNNDSLHKPYIAIVQVGNYIDWNTLEQVPSLPDKPFLFNYTAKRYNETLGAFDKEDGQLFDTGIGVGNLKSNIVASNDYVDFIGDAYYTKNYNSISDNPFNRTSADCNFTFIYKTSGFTNSGNRKIFSNRRVGGAGYQGGKYDCHNYIISSDAVFGFEGNFAPINNPQYVVIRAFDDNSGLRQEVDANGNTIQSAATQFVEWDNPSAGAGFFTGGYNYNLNIENFRGKFYWMYCANQTLTDEEVLKVIRYNDSL